MTNALDDLDRAFPAGSVLPSSWLDPSGRDPEGLTAAMQPFGRSRMLPAAAYTSPEVLAWERRHLFAGTWTCVGREDDLRHADGGAPRRAGGGALRHAGGGASRALTQRALVVGDVPVVLTWSGDSIHAFANTCRHRAHELLPPGQTATRQSIVCPYHAWSFDLQGSLRAAPGYQDVTGFEPAQHALVELPVERWQGWLFVHATTSVADGGAPVDFTSHIGDLGQLVEPYDVEALVLRERHSYEVAANWKVISENYHECYHCPLIHPELCQVTPPTSGDNYVLPGAWVGGSMDLRDGMQTMSMTGESRGVPIQGVDPARVEYLGLWPNLLISAHPDYVMAHRMVPLAPNRTQVECSWFFPDRGDTEAVDPSYAVEFWDLTNRQDWNACESVQRGLSSPHFISGPFGPGEDAVHQFVTMVGRGYRGLPLHKSATS